jgi:RNA polymerase sigma-70 factor (ECF subfamily)
VVDAFLAAARNGDFEALLRLLDPDVVVRIDGGPNAPPQLARPPIVGAAAVASEARNFREVGARFEPVIVNGGAGLLVRFPARALLWAFTIVDGRVAAIDLIADPAKLRDLPVAT